MKYYLNLFSPETYEAFTNSSQQITGFRIRQRGIAKRIEPGDILVCYMTRLSRWVGLFEVVDGPFEDSTPIFVPEDDPFIVRFNVRPIVWLGMEKAIPIHDKEVWEQLSFTRHLEMGAPGWTGKLRSSLIQLDADDGQFLTNLLKSQFSNARDYPLDEQDEKKLAVHTVNRPDKTITVTIPDDSQDADEVLNLEQVGIEIRESTKIQALIAKIGSQMGYSIWIPRADRNAVLSEWSGEHKSFIERLPLNYDEVTLRTIEQIDVLWVRQRFIVRAFEVEHTTSIYSGILRMADLLALQPNMKIALHIVAPSVRREKVFQEIQRPVFSLLDGRPLVESCTYLAYESIRELSELQHLNHLLDTVLEEYAEGAGT